MTKNGVKHTGLNLAATDKDAIDFLNGKAEIINKDDPTKTWFKPLVVECPTAEDKDNNTKCTAMTRGDCKKCVTCTKTVTYQLFTMPMTPNRIQKEPTHNTLNSAS